MQVSIPETVFPFIRPRAISDKVKATIDGLHCSNWHRSLHVIGLINIQFIVCGEDVYVIEVNPRSSRTVPYISKVTGIPIVPLATKVILGQKIRESGLYSRDFSRKQIILRSRCRYSPLRRSAARISAWDRR